MQRLNVLTLPRRATDGHLLASSCTLMPHVESTVVLVAGTGTVGLGERLNPPTPLVAYTDPLSGLPTAFKKRGVELDLVGVSGGWGYL